MLRKLLYYIFVAIGAYLLSGLMINALINRAIYQAPRPSYSFEDESIVKIKSSKGKDIAVVWLPVESAKCTVLYSHGNATDLGRLEPFFKLLNQLNLNVISYDYQGYGASEGVFSEKNSYADVRATYDYLINVKKIPAQEIILYGTSLGSGPTLELATQIAPPTAIILQSPFMSVYHRAIRLPLYPFNRYENHRKITQIKSPILIIHGERDNVIPAEQGKKLYELAPEPKDALWVPGAKHNGLISTAIDDYVSAIRNIAPQCF